MTTKKIKTSDILGSSYYAYELSSSNYTPALNGTITITCTCKDVYGNAVGSKSLTLYQNGTSKGSQTTNNNGVATWSITCSTAGLQKFNIEDTSIEVFVDNKAVSSHQHGNITSDGKLNTSHNGTYSTFIGVQDSTGTLYKASKINSDIIIDGTAHANIGSNANDNQSAINTAINTALGNKANSTHTHSDYLTSHQDITGKEDITNKVTSLSSSSTDTQYPSAKAVYDALESGANIDIGTLISGLYIYYDEETDEIVISTTPQNQNIVWDPKFIFNDTAEEDNSSTIFGNAIGLRNTGTASTTYVTGTPSYYLLTNTKNNAEAFIPYSELEGIYDKSFILTIKSSAVIEMYDVCLIGLYYYIDSNNWGGVKGDNHEQWSSDNTNGTFTETNKTGVQTVSSKTILTEFIYNAWTNTLSIHCFEEDGTPIISNTMDIPITLTSGVKWGTSTTWKNGNQHKVYELEAKGYPENIIFYDSCSSSNGLSCYDDFPHLEYTQETHELEYSSEYVAYHQLNGTPCVHELTGKTGVRLSFDAMCTSSDAWINMFFASSTGNGFFYGGTSSKWEGHKYQNNNWRQTLTGTTTGSYSTGAWYHGELIKDGNNVTINWYDLISGTLYSTITQTYEDDENYYGINGSYIRNITAEYLIGLTAEKTIVSYANNETIQVHATYYNGSGATMGLYNADTNTKIGDFTDNGDGTYTCIYESTGAGDVNLIAKVGTTTSPTLTIEDCLFYGIDTTKFTIPSDATFTSDGSKITATTSTSGEKLVYFDYEFNQNDNFLFESEVAELGVSQVVGMCWNDVDYYGGQYSDTNRAYAHLTNNDAWITHTFAVGDKYRVVRQGNTTSAYINDDLISSNTSSSYKSTFKVGFFINPSRTQHYKNIKIKLL